MLHSLYCSIDPLFTILLFSLLVFYHHSFIRSFSFCFLSLINFFSFLYLPFLSFILFHQNSFFFFLSFLTNLSYSFLFLYSFQSSFFLFFLFLGRYLILSVSPSLTFSGQLDFFIATADLLPIHSRWLDIIHLTQCFLYTQRSHITMVQGPIH